jgi:DNA-binding HxlR family transcriptional regulator
MRHLKPGSAPECATEHTLRVIGGSWKIPIVNFLSHQTRRYSELQRNLRGISPRVLAKQLRELERDGIIVRKIYPTIPPKVEYSLTPFGRTLEPILGALFDWGAKHMVRGV